MSEVIEAPQSAATELALGPAPNSPMGMMMAAVQQGIPLEQVEKMMDLHQRWEEREAEKAFNDSLAAFKSEAVEIVKRREVDFTNRDNKRTHYKHAELSDVVEAVGPALSKYGFAWSWRTEQQNGTIRVTCILKHRLGHSDSVALEASPDQTGGKNNIQALASTVTYLQRHTLKAITGVSEKGDDNDGNLPDTATHQADAGGQVELPTYTDEQFEEKLAQWKEIIDAGKANAARIIQMSASKVSLTDEQKQRIRELEGAPA